MTPTLNSAALNLLFQAAVKHIEWIEKERRGPDYFGLTRANHPNGEAIWRAWWDEQSVLCGDTEDLCRAAIALATGETP